MRRPWAGTLARWLTRGRPARAIAVIMTGCLAARQPQVRAFGLDVFAG